MLRIVDPKDAGRLTFEALGRFMRLIGVYLILFNEKRGVHAKPVCGGKVECDSRCCHHNQHFMTRVKKENDFQANLWRMLNVMHCGYIHTSLLRDLVVTLYESNYVPQGTLAARIKGKFGF